ncbi:uncharacterized protein ARMOST_19316 [Armillaria ostoyae]|uniref:Uncharacterized protein n=1 Tax=Armillaria ostoyae TaxID=47428 RepID=A0A284S479_ARMOS|nr:uncharacterized protein ARMOST_19316 [Armillaria ostoyae]
MASIEHIEATATRITDRILDMDLRGLPRDFAVLMRKLREFVEQQEEVLAAARAELESATARNNMLADELEASKKFTKHLLNHRRIVDMARSEAVARSARIQAQVERLWAALQPRWRTVEQELTCHVCCHKLWSAVRFAGSVWFLVATSYAQAVLMHGLNCNLVVTRRPLRAHLVEQAVRKLPTVNEEERTEREEVDWERGYRGDASWSDFF